MTAATAPAAAATPAFVFGPQVPGGVDAGVVALVCGEGGAALDRWCAATGDPALAAAIRRFVDAGEIELRWLQSAVTAVQLAVADALARRGVEPAAVAGLSMGELAAAVVAGRLDIGEAARVARGVSALFAASDGDGRMAAVAADRASLLRVPGADAATLAVTLAPRMQVIAGRRGDLARASAGLRAAGIEVHELHLPHAFHSGAVEAIREPFLRELGALAPRPGRARFYSGIDASPRPALDAAYWWRVCREPFYFDDAVRAMLAGGVRWFVELGSRPILARYILAIAAELRVDVRVEPAHALLVAR